MLDLFAIATGNADAVLRAFDSAVASLPAGQASAVREFAAWVEAEALVSLNLRLFVLVDVLHGQPYQNIHEWAREQARLSGRSSDDALRERLGGFYDKRVTFDRGLKNGEQFRYGALNAGGVGLPEYAPYCAVLTRAFRNSLRDVALLPGDSLKICIAPDGTLDEAVVRNRTTPHTHRHWMAATERAGEIPAAHKRGWPELVVAPGRYFEVIFLGEVSLDSFQCVRVLKTEYDRMCDLAFANFGRKLGDAERALVHDFIQLRRGTLNGKMQVEVIA